jgi:hypothetical protein
MSADWVPTAKLRWIHRRDDAAPTSGLSIGGTVLQQWWAADVPGYMRRDAEGEWRDVVVEQEPAP